MATLTYKINIDGKGVLTKDIIIDVVGGGGVRKNEYCWGML